MNRFNLTFFDSNSALCRTLEEQDKYIFDEVNKLIQNYEVVKKVLLSYIDSKQWKDVEIPINTVSLKLIKLQQKIEESKIELEKQNTEKTIKDLEESIALLRDRKHVQKNYTHTHTSLE